MKIGIAQLNSNDDAQKNLAQIKQIISQSQSQKPAMIFFPENSLYMRINPNEAVKAVSLDDAIIAELKDICAEAQIAIHLTTPIKENLEIFNASVLIDSKHHAKIIYKKIHLFDIELTDQEPIRESDAFAPGNEPVVFQIEDFKIGSSICYDIRFAELYSVYAKAEVDVILVPAAFLVKTGRAHWQVLLRARAIESQCYVIAPAQAGIHQSGLSELKRETFGHSMIIDPWGEVSAVKTDGVGIFFAELSHELIQKVRQQIPMKIHRRSHRRIDF